MINYLVSWLNCAKSDGLTINYLGGWNERGYNISWYEQLRSTLNADGYSGVQIVAADSDPADPIIADYYAFGASNFDTSTALSDMVAEATTANDNRPGLNYLNAPGYLPADGTYGCNFYGPVSTTLEYDTADFAISAFAGALGNTGGQQTFVNRAQDWRNVLNADSGFDQPRNTDGTWTSGFDPTSGTDFVEADSWIYTGMVPFDLAGLTQAKGGDAAMNAYLATVLSSYTGANGYAWVGNEPSVELPWEYDYTGEPYQTQETVRQIQDQIWTDSPSGLADGNDDLGAMSAWYVWSALGMYPETPGTPTLALGSPMFTTAVVTLPSGSTLTINGNGAADDAPYVQSATWNGGSWNNAYAPASAITSGGTLTYTLGTSPDTSWASGAAAAPPSYSGNTVAPPDPQVGPIAANVGSGLCIDDANSSTTPATPYRSTAATAPPRSPGPSPPTAPSAPWACAWMSTEPVPPTAPLSTSTPVTAAPTSSGPPAPTAPWSTPPLACALTTPISVPPTGPSSTSGPCNGGANQDWTLPAALPAETGTITSGVDGLCVDDNGGSTANGSRVQTWGCDGSAAQDWTVEPDGTLRTEGGCMDVTDGGSTNGTLVQLYACNGTGAQQWHLTTSGQIINPHSGLCLDDPNFSTTNGTQLDIWTCNGGANQKWTTAAS